MTKIPLVVSALLVATSIAHASPSATVVPIDVDFDKIDHRALFRKLPQADAEPGGIVIPTDTDGTYKLLGLETGDIVRYQNGSPVGDDLRIHEGHTLLELDRKGKTIYVALDIHGSGKRRPTTLTDDDFKAAVQRAQEAATAGRLGVPLTLRGAPSGVRIVDFLLSIRLPFEVGDIVRSVGGNTVHDANELAAAIAALKVGANDIVLERDGRPLTISVTRDEPLDVSRIRRVSETSFIVPKSIQQAAKKDWLLVGRHVDATPAVSKGAIHGWKLLKIEPGSLLGALGLRDDDVVLDVDGRSIDDTAQQIEVHTDLEEATTVTIHVERKGKTLAIVYKVE